MKRAMRRRNWGCELLLFASLWSGAEAQRPLAYEDISTAWSLGRHGYQTGASFRRDGTAVAWTVVRPFDSSSIYSFSELGAGARADMCISELPSGKKKFELSGQDSGEGFWAPSWSPDGSYLALLAATEKGPELWIWSDVVNAVIYKKSIVVQHLYGPQFAWIGVSEMLWLAPDCTSASLTVAGHGELLERAYRSVAQGKKTTASAISGAGIAEFARPVGHLMLLDLKTGETKTVCRSLVGAWQVSNQGYQVVAWTLTAAKTDISDARTYSLAVANLVRETPPYLVGSEFCRPTRIAWSPDDSLIAFSTSSNEPQREGLYIASTCDQLLYKPRCDLELMGSVPLWTSEDQLLVRGRRSRAKELEVFPWYVVGLRGGSRRLFPNDTEPILSFSQADASFEYVGTDKARLWRIRRGGHAEEISRQEITGQIRTISVARSKDNVPGSSDSVDQFMVEVNGKREGDIDYYLSVIQNGKTSWRPIPFVRQGQRILGKCPEAADLFLVGSDTLKGLSIGCIDIRTGAYVKFADMNAHLFGVTDVQSEPIAYRGNEGQSRSGWMIRPWAFLRNKRYPTVIWIYPGTVYSDSEIPEVAKFTGGQSPQFALQLLASRGYQVFLPSIPLALKEEGNDLLKDIVDGALAAVVAVKKDENTLPDDVFVMGHSFGGYAVCALIGATDCLRGAIASSAATDLTSMYGTLPGDRRYTSDPVGNGYHNIGLLEKHPFNMRSTPWGAASRYRDNSPIYYVDKIRTPVLLIHGDRDFCPMQQSEAFYIALRRESKPVEFVRYWGEGHWLRSSANIKDMWERIFDWMARQRGLPVSGRRK